MLELADIKSGALCIPEKPSPYAGCCISWSTSTSGAGTAQNC